MGKPLTSQRRGKGSPSFTAKSTRFKARAKYRSRKAKDVKVIRAQVVEFIDDPARSGLLMAIKYEDDEIHHLPAPEGIMLGGVIEDGSESNLEIGCILPLRKIPEGFPVFNLETTPGDGGSLIRASGTCAYVVSRQKKGILVKLPSGKRKIFNPGCRAMIGCVSGGGRREKPLLKAGKGWYKHKARGHYYPIVRGVKMNAYDHPFGGKQHHGAKTKKGKGAPPGQHVGSFGAKRTGRKKR